MSALEDQVAQEEADYQTDKHAAEDPLGDADEGEPGDDLTAQAEELFDSAEYLQLPMIGRRGIDRIAIKFSGEVMLDRSSRDDVELFKSLAFGDEVELRVAGRILAVTGRGATNRDGDLDVVVGQKTIKVDTVYVLAPENLR